MVHNTLTVAVALCLLATPALPLASAHWVGSGVYPNAPHEHVSIAADALTTAAYSPNSQRLCLRSSTLTLTWSDPTHGGCPSGTTPIPFLRETSISTGQCVDLDHIDVTKAESRWNESRVSAVTLDWGSASTLGPLAAWSDQFAHPNWGGRGTRGHDPNPTGDMVPFYPGYVSLPGPLQLSLTTLGAGTTSHPVVGTPILPGVDKGDNDPEVCVGGGSHTYAIDSGDDKWVAGLRPGVTYSPVVGVGAGEGLLDPLRIGGDCLYDMTPGVGSGFDGGCSPVVGTTGPGQWSTPAEILLSPTVALDRPLKYTVCNDIASSGCTNIPDAGSGARYGNGLDLGAVYASLQDCVWHPDMPERKHGISENPYRGGAAFWGTDIANGHPCWPERLVRESPTPGTEYLPSSQGTGIWDPDTLPATPRGVESLTVFIDEGGLFAWDDFNSGCAAGTPVDPFATCFSPTMNEPSRWIQTPVSVIALNAVFQPISPTPPPGPGSLLDDSDQDRVPDWLEEWICFQDLSRQLVNAARAGGSCKSPRDYAPRKAVEADANANDYGDDWERQLGTHVQEIVDQLDADADFDWLTNIREFRWLTLPIYLFPNARDYDEDGWQDGPEVAYWNDASNDNLVIASSIRGAAVVIDPDFHQSFDDDNLTTTHDPDSDNDGLLDGDEVNMYETYPEHVDSDCAFEALQCPTPSEAGTIWNARASPSKPGKGDRINDSAELATWETISLNAWFTDYDADEIPTNLLDPDSDGDVVLDGVEFTCVPPACTSPAKWDTDRDGLLDGSDQVIFPSDPRFDLFRDDNVSLVVYATNPDGSRTYKGEQTNGALAWEWDTDDDGLPDGWEVAYNLNPTAQDAELDIDNDGLTILQEYGYDRPSWWIEAQHGTWWYGTDPRNRDTDGDGADDGTEVAHGTNPRDGQSTYHGGMPRDPTGQWSTFEGFDNEDLPEELMDPTNLHYLRENIVDASATANETVDVIDQLTSALISGNVTQALNVVYNETPIGPPLQDLASTVEASTQAVVGILRCATDLADNTTQTIDDPSGGAGNATQTAGAAQASVEQAPECVSEALTPFLDHLVNRTLTTLEPVTSFTQSLIPAPVPALVSDVTSLIAPVVDTAERALLADPSPEWVLSTLDELSLLNGSQEASNPLPATQAALQVAAAPLIPATSRHPTFTYDTLHAGGLDIFWPLVQEAQEAGEGQGVHPLGVTDSFTFNLYTERSSASRITRVLVGDRTCVQLDDGTTTRDGNGCDLYATLTVSTQSLPAQDGASAGYRVSSTLRVERAVPTASFDVLALGYLQVQNAPIVMVLGYNATDGHPRVWEGTIQDYDTRETANRSMSFASHIEDARASIPLHLVAGAFKVNMTHPNKPALGDHGTTLEAQSPNAPKGVSMRIARTSTPGSPAQTSTLSVTTTVSSASTWEVAYNDTIGSRTGLVQWNATNLPAGSSKLTTTGRNAEATSWTWSAPTTTPTLEIHAREEGASRIERAFELAAQDLPSAEYASDASTHQHGFQLASLSLLPSTPATSLSFLVAEGRTDCPSLQGQADTHLLVEKQETSLCASARLDKHHALRVQADATQLQVTGSLTDAVHGSSRVVLKEDHEAYVDLASTPTSWVLRHENMPNGTKQTTWSAATDVSAALFDVTLRDENERPHRATAQLTSLPTQLVGTMDLAAETIKLDAIQPLGEAAFTFSSTGNAPNAAPSDGGNYFRIRKLADPEDSSPRAADYEAAYRLDATQSIAGRVQPDGTFALDAQLDSPLPLHAYYERAGYAVRVDSTTTSGAIRLTIKPGDVAGSITLGYDGPASIDGLQVLGHMPEGSVRWTATGVPAQVLIDADAAQQTFRLDAAGALASTLFEYAASGSPIASSHAGGSHIVLRELATTPIQRSLSANLQGVTTIRASQTAGDVHLDGVFSTQPLFLGFTKLDETATLALASAPTTLDVTQKAGTFRWNAPGSTGTSFDYSLSRPQEPRYLTASMTSAPASVQAAWTTSPAGTMDLRHDGAGIPSLILEESTPNTPSGLRFAGSDLPARVNARIIHASGEVAVSGQTAGGALATMSGFELAFVAGGSTLPLAPSSWTGDFVLVQDSGTSSKGSLRLLGARELRGALLSPDVGTPASLTLDHTGTRDLLVDLAGSGGAKTNVKHFDAPPQTAVSFKPGNGAGADGFNATIRSSASGGALFAYVQKAGHVLQVDIPTTPQTFDAGWTRGLPLTLSASEPIHPTILFADSEGAAPFVPDASKDYVAIHDAQTGSVSAGLRLTGVQSLVVDPAGGRLEAQSAPGVTNAITIDHQDAAGMVSLHASDLPTTLDASWHATSRELTLSTSPALDLFHLEVRPTSEHASRLQTRIEGVPTGTTNLSQPVNGTFTFQAPGSVARVIVAADRGGATPLRLLDEKGLRITRTQGLDEMQLDLTNLQVLQTVEGANEIGRSLVMTRSADALPARIRLDHPEQSLFANLTLGASEARIEWPKAPTQADGDLALRFHAQGLGSAPAQLVVVNADQDQAEVVIESPPTAWTTTFAPTGSFTHAGQSSLVRLRGTWLGAAVDAIVWDAPTTLSLVPEQDMLAGVLATTGGPAGRASIALAPAGGPNGGGSVPKLRDSATDYLSVDSTVAGGLLVLDLSDLTRAQWAMPSGPADETPLGVRIERAIPTTTRGLVQLVHPDQQTRLTLNGGMPATLDLTLAQDASGWASTIQATGKNPVLQHQAGEGKTIVFGLMDAPGAASVAFAPRDATNTLTYGATGPAALVRVESAWADSYARARLLNGAPAMLRIESGGSLLQEGLVTTGGTGSVGVLDAFFVPDATQTVNRVNPRFQHLAVDTNAKVPYLSIVGMGFQDASWSLPDATSNSAVTASLARTTPTGGTTLVALSGPGDDVTAKIRGAPAGFALDVLPSTRAQTAPGGTAQPFRVTYTPTGPTGRLDLTHLHGQTGETGVVALLGSSAATILSATGALVPTIRLDALTPPSYASIQTTDGGTFLNMVATEPTPTLVVSAARGSCTPADPSPVIVSSAGTGVAGRTFVQIGDHSKVPPAPATEFVDVRCQPEDVSVGVRLPFVNEALWTQTKCPAGSDLLGGLEVSIAGRSDMQLPFAFATPFLFVTGKTKTEASTAITKLTIGCEEGVFFLDYESKDANKNPSRLKLADIDIVPTVPPAARDATSEAPADTTDVTCPMRMSDACVQQLLFSGEDLPPAANARFQGPDGRTGLVLNGHGSSAGHLDVDVQLEKIDKPKKDLHLGIVSNMPVGWVQFRKFDVENPPKPQGNEVIVRSDGQDVVAVRLEDVTSATFLLDKLVDKLDLTVHANYVGSTTKGLNLHIVNDECSAMRTVLSDVPSSLLFDLHLGGFKNNAIVADTSATIRELGFTSRLGASCDKTGGGGTDFSVKAKGIPAGHWNVGAKFGAAGFLGLHADGASFGEIEVGLAVPNNPNRYLALAMRDASFGFEWDLDGHSGTEAHPRYVHCDGFDTKWTFRARYDMFGVGIAPRGGVGAKLGCDHLQVKWYFAPTQIPLCSVNQGCISTMIPLPNFKRAGQFTGTVGIPAVEVLYAGRWFSTPDRLWET